MLPRFHNTEAGEAVGAKIQELKDKQRDAAYSAVDAWRSFAVAQGLELTRNEETDELRLEGRVHDVACTLELVRDEDHWFHTLATADISNATSGGKSDDVVVTLHPTKPDGVLTSMRNAVLGSPDVGTLNDSYLDRRFRIHSAPEEASSKMFDPDLQSLLRQSLDANTDDRLEIIKYDGGIAYVQSSGVDTDAASLTRMLEIAARLAASRKPASPYR